ncbi:MAG: hypothetical protein K6A72_02970 [Lachnospiraceae bacterium]|nr:hypothetical protein [Lachnospiraceae bacterium]
MKERIRESNGVYRGVALIMLVASATGMLPGWLDEVFKAAAVPMLFASVGVDLFCNDEIKDVGAVLKKSAFRFLIPYAAFSVIYIIIGLLPFFKNAVDGAGSDPSMAGLIADAVSFYGISVLWVFPTAFIAVTVYCAVVRFMSVRSLTVMTTLMTLSFTVIISLTELFPYNFIIEGGTGAGGYMARISIVFLRGLYGLFFVCCGSICTEFSSKVKERRMRLGVPGGLFLAAGIAVSALMDMDIDLQKLYFLNAVPLLFTAAFLTAGMWFISAWVEKVYPLNFFGDNAAAVLVSFRDLGALGLATLVGDNIFRAFDNNFATRLSVAIVLIAAEIVWILVLRLPGVRVLVGKK